MRHLKPLFHFTIQKRDNTIRCRFELLLLLLLSGQLPCRSAEVNFFSVFLCQSCREIWREILVKFSVLRFPGFGCATENFTKISRQKRCEKRKISRKFHSAGAQRWLLLLLLLLLPFRWCWLEVLNCSAGSKPVRIRTYLHERPQTTKTDMYKFAPRSPRL